MTSREFLHNYQCNHHDTMNCSACALTDTTQEKPNYCAWPLAYMENRRAIPAKWRNAFREELQRDNALYVENLKKTMTKFGVMFTDGKGLGD